MYSVRIHLQVWNPFLTAEIGSSVSLDCSYSADVAILSNLVVNWSWNSKAMDSHRNQTKLVIDKVARDNAGQYECTVTTDMGEIKR